MCFGAVLGAGLSIASSQIQSGISKKAAARDAKILKIQAAQSLVRGEMDAATVGREFSQLVGRQKAVFASQGFDVSVGDPERIIEDTLAIGRQEQALVQYNAQLDAWAANESAAGASPLIENLQSNIPAASASGSGVPGIASAGSSRSRPGSFSSVGRVS